MSYEVRNVLCSFCRNPMLDHPRMAVDRAEMVKALGSTYGSVGATVDRLDCGELREIESVRAGRTVAW